MQEKNSILSCKTWSVAKPTWIRVLSLISNLIRNSSGTDNQIVCSFLKNKNSLRLEGVIV